EESKPMKTPMSSDTKLTKEEELSASVTASKRLPKPLILKRLSVSSDTLKKQTALAVSTTEAEYVSARKACQQALWMKQALIDYDVRVSLPKDKDLMSWHMVSLQMVHIKPTFLPLRTSFRLFELIDMVKSVASVMRKRLIENPEMQNESYVLYDRVMTLLAAQLEQKLRRDRGTIRGRHFTSSSSAFNQPSSSHRNDDDDDGNDERTSRAKPERHALLLQSISSTLNHELFSIPSSITFSFTSFYHEFHKCSSSNPSKKIKLTIIPPRQLFVNISNDEDITTTPSPTTTSSSPTHPNAPSKTTSTNQTSSSQENTSSSFHSKLQISLPSSHEPNSPPHLNPLLNNILDVPPRPLNPQPLQSHPSLDITLALSRITPLDHTHDTTSPPSPPQPQPPIIDLNAQLQEKVFAITALKNELRKLKGKNVVNTVVSKPNATLAPGMFKLDIEPISPRLKNNRDAHEVYIEKTIEYADTLHGFVERARTQYPSEPLLESACMFTKHVQELLVYASQTCPNSPKPSEKLVAVTPINKDKRVRFAEPVTSSNNIPKQTDSLKTKDSNKPLLTSTGVKPTTSASGSKPSGNTKNNRITRPPHSNQKNKVVDHPRKVKSSLNKTKSVSCNLFYLMHLFKLSVRNAKFESICAICNKCLFDANHDMCLVDFVNDVNVRSKSKSKRNKKSKAWKPTGKVFTDVGYKWKPTGRSFTIIGNSCPLRAEVFHRIVFMDIRTPDVQNLLKGNRSHLMNLLKLAKDGLARGIPKLKFQKDHLCSACALGKRKKSSHQPKAEDTNQEKLYLLHMDLCGPMRAESINGKKYILVIVDDYSQFT
ncbi:retrovirus-related pol polyprotein from transposon TNT 1-94, partial [Tanacetum coccineum]